MSESAHASERGIIRAFLFTDLVGSTYLTQQVGDIVLRREQRRLEPIRVAALNA